MERSRDRQPAPPIWLAAICGVAVVQIAMGLAGLACSFAGVDWPRLTPIPDALRAIHVATFGSLAAYLLTAGRRDSRVVHLGALFLLFSLSYAHPPIEALVRAAPSLAPTVAILRAVTVDAFTPVLAWLFFRDFPRALDWPRTAGFVRFMVGGSAVAAGALIVANLALALGAESAALAAWDRSLPDSPYWTVVFGLLLPIPPFIVWRMRHAPEDERRRVRLFGFGFALAAVLPLLYIVLPPLSDRLRDAMLSGPLDAVLRPLVQLMILSIPIATTYAVVVQRVLDVRTILRAAAQYGLARVVVGAVALVPAMAGALLLYESRMEPLAALFTGRHLLTLIAIGLSWFAILRLRRRLMESVDRIFLREPYDPHQILADLGEHARTVGSARELAERVLETIDGALHVDSAHVIALDAPRHHYFCIGGGLRTLPESSALVSWIAANPEPRRVDVERRSALESWSEADRLWLADGGVELVVPVFGEDEDLTAAIALGAKRSELPFSREDLVLLRAVGVQVGGTLATRILRESPTTRESGARIEADARECSACGQIEKSPQAAAPCSECGGVTRPSRLPAVFLGKYQLEQRVGSGAMGVVYRALDLALRRPVALKTLPATSPEDSLRLRREARAMAAITHPNLALIFGAESWRGTPVLVMEYLAGGTLDDRTRERPLGLHRAIEVLHAIAGGLERTHRAGLLHRDVKPSNIGFAEGDVAKLLDFGLARIAGDPPAVPTSLADDADLAKSESGVVGTPLYMSPEALAGARPDPSFDLWALGVVAYEAATGAHPFERETGAETWKAIRNGWTPALATQMGPASPEAMQLFAALLASSRASRPRTARVVGQLAATALEPTRPGAVA